MNNALGDERAAERQPCLYTDLERSIELVEADDIRIYKQFAKAVCRTFCLRMAVHSFESFMNRLAVASCNCQRFNTHIRRNQSVTNY